MIQCFWFNSISDLLVVINGVQNFANPFLNRWLIVNVGFPLDATNQMSVPLRISSRCKKPNACAATDLNDVLC
jgi:hypothetical protein